MGKKKKDTRKKRTHQIQLDINKNVDAWLHEWIPVLKTKHKFSEYIRDGLTLMFYFAEWGLSVVSVLAMLGEMREGKRDKMYEVFPHLRTESAEQGITPEPQPTPTTPDNSKEIEELRKSNEQLQKMVEELTELVLSIRLNGGMVMQSTGQGKPKQLTLKQFELPKFEDDDDETQPAIAMTKNTSTSAISNFIGAAMALQ